MSATLCLGAPAKLLFERTLARSGDLPTVSLSLNVDVPVEDLLAVLASLQLQDGKSIQSKDPDAEHATTFVGLRATSGGPPPPPPELSPQAAGEAWPEDAGTSPAHGFVAEAGDEPTFDPFEQHSEHASVHEELPPAGHHHAAARSLAREARGATAGGDSGAGPGGDDIAGLAARAGAPGSGLDEVALAPGGPYCPRALSVLRGHSSSVEALAWSPEGSRLVTGSASHTACIWRASGSTPWQWKAARTIRGFADGFRDGFRALAWSPDGMRLAAAGSDSCARVLSCHDEDLRHMDVVSVLSGHAGALWDLAWSPSGKSLLTASDDRTALVWQASRPGSSQWEVVAALRGHADAVRAVAWAPDSRQAITGSADCSARIWRPYPQAAGWYLATTLSRHRAPVQSVSWAHAETLLTAGDDGCFVWRAAPVSGTGSGEQFWEPVVAIGTDCGPILSAAWSPDGSRVATGGVDAILRVWGTASADEGSDGYAPQYGATQVWEPPRSSWVLLAALEGHRHTIKSLKWSPDGTRLASGSSDQTARIWEAPQ